MIKISTRIDIDARSNGQGSYDAGRSTPYQRRRRVTDPGTSPDSHDAGRPTLDQGRKAPYQIGSFYSDGVHLSYEIHGSGDRTLMYLPGLLLDANLNRRLARDLAMRGNKVILMDFPGHGSSDKPLSIFEHGMDRYAAHALALLDHLEVDQAVIGGVSLGAGVSLFMASSHPERVEGLVVEMPVLDYGMPDAAVVFLPLLLVSRYMRLPYHIVNRIVQSIPRTPVETLNSFLDAAAIPPDQAAAVLEGLFAGRLFPSLDELSSIKVPVMVLGHRADFIHSLADARHLASILPNARFVQAKSLVELRVAPRRLTGEIAQFLDEIQSPDIPDIKP